MSMAENAAADMAIIMGTAMTMMDAAADTTMSMRSLC